MPHPMNGEIPEKTIEHEPVARNEIQPEQDVTIDESDVEPRVHTISSESCYSGEDDDGPRVHTISPESCYSDEDGTV